LQRNLNLFDLLLNEIYVWETLENDHKTLAIEILVRLIANAAVNTHDQEQNHECASHKIPTARAASKTTIDIEIKALCHRSKLRPAR
jgi:hypothetical protein